MRQASEIQLYKREEGYIPRVAAVHDLCGYGKCSLGVAIPVLSAAGMDVCPVPTSLFSTHTLYPNFHMHDTTEMLDDYLAHWREVNIGIDAVYSGFLGAAEQVASIKEIYTDHPDALRVVDPVMGDGGKIYPTYTPELCDQMGSLVNGADLLTPNLTEASQLTGLPYPGQSPTDEQTEEILDALIDLGAKYVVLKGIVRGERIQNHIKGHDCEHAIVEEDLLPFYLHGTGDLYCSSLLAALMAEHDLLESVEFASRFVVEAMVISQKQPDFQKRGVNFEPLLGKVAALLEK